MNKLILTLFACTALIACELKPKNKGTPPPSDKTRDSVHGDIGNDGTSPDPSQAPVCTKDGWCTVHRLPKKYWGAFEKIWASGPNDVFAVGGYGTIFHFDGKRWSRHKSDAKSNLVAIKGTGPKNVYAVGTLRTILHYNGRRWKTELGPLGNENSHFCRDIVIAENGDAYAKCNDGTLHRKKGRWVKGEIPKALMRLVNEPPHPWPKVCLKEKLPKIQHFEGEWIAQCGNQNLHLYSRDKNRWVRFGSRTKNTFYRFARAGKRWIGFNTKPPVIYRDTTDKRDKKAPWQTLVWPEKVYRMPQTIYAVNKTDLYISGTNGNVFHYDGNTLKSEATGTRAEITAFWQTGNHVYAVAHKRILRKEIKPQTGY